MYRTEDYKMIIYPKANVVRLYDMKKDPFEKNDLAENKEESRAILTELFQEFSLLQKEMNDPLDIETAFNNFLNQ